MKLARDGFARRDTFQKLYPDWSFHCRVYATFRESCSRACVLAPATITLGIVFGEADPPKGGTRCPQRVGKQRPEGPNLQRATDCCGHGAETRNELGENLRRQRLIAVALGHFGRIVHFDHERVCAGSNRGQTHLRNKFAKTESVRWIDYDRQMRLGL